MNRLKYYAPRLLLAVVASCIALAAPEGLARLAYRVRRGAWPVSQASAVADARSQVKTLFREHSILPFVLRPGAKVQFMDTYAEVNSSGFRGDELRSTTPLRILVVGGSTAFDTGVTGNAETWCSRLEIELAPALKDVEVVNAGVPAYPLWANYLKYVLYDRYSKPDVVLVYQGLNDALPWWPAALDRLRDDYWDHAGVAARLRSGIPGEQRSSPEPALPDLLSHSVLVRGAWNERGRNENVYASLTQARSAEDALPDGLLEKKVGMLAYFVAAVRSDGALPALVPQSLGGSAREGSFGARHRLWAVTLARLNSAYLAYARAAGVKVVDLRDTTDAWGDAHFRDLAHFNDRGAREFAAVLAAKLRADPDIGRIHAAHSAEKRAMPTRTLEELVITDSKPGLPGPIDVRVTLVSPDVRGFHPVEGPYPQWRMHKPVRWMRGASAEIHLAGGPQLRGSFALELNALSAAHGQRLEVLVNGVTVADHAFRKPNEWERIASSTFPLASARNVLEFRAARTVRQDGRELGVLFDEITVSQR